MKYLLIYLIKTYWLLIPKSKRRKCIFRTSCSKYVYEIASKKGLYQGLKAFKYRYKNCRHGFQIFKNPVNHKTYLILPNQEIINNENIAERLLK